jgi:hypothetical protein
MLEKRERGERREKGRGGNGSSLIGYVLPN